VICIIISISIVSWLSSFVFSSTTTTDHNNLILSSKAQIPQFESLHSNRLIKYCSFIDHDQLTKGEEGKYVDDVTNHFEMKALLITIRHGDRSAIHSIPGKYTLKEEEENNNNNHHPYLFDPKVHQYTSSANRFILVPITGTISSSSSSTDVSFMDALDSTHLFSRSDTTLPQGQLTSTGFMQHIHLGDHLQQAYATFIRSVTSAKDVYIRSTNYHRTIQVGR